MKSASEFLEHIESEGLAEFSFEENSVKEVKLAKKKLILHQKKFRIAPP